jgi:hypothetical protein
VVFFPDSEFWHCAVNEPDLPGINGGGLPTLDEARWHAIEVLALTLRSEEQPSERAGAHVEHLPVGAR